MRRAPRASAHAFLPLRVSARVFCSCVAHALRSGLFYYGFRFAFMTFLLDGPILFGAWRRQRRARASHVRAA
jgi:hypothetical protein